MTINEDKYEKKLANKLAKFSSTFMSNTKWTKLFEKLSQNKDSINMCLMKNIYDELLREICIPKIDNFTTVFHDKGFNDSYRNQPYLFKEIQWIEFPAKWTIGRQMRGQNLEPHKYEQDILKIKKQIENIGQFQIECESDKLIIYGYK